ncbi:MAG: hypothetical protein A2919_00520 [Candidatus Spechtbacteria bacterium RIFCSPLOWO2_01_FULL_43_12]|uniref:Uncharacterized protein n=1 Tax=Candidatus Spechtbacteria bacterium RIFCSPLOWO2_01_FULL_43_12 TaxID=1802162 RepID=A0A1G2HES4_9BACT|nr:MAG: hypothetical protein A2919_00520 [Candidatus Spechtbacteria bacterium RIFCSPLOWO2_01_FULL_43_12]
MSKTIKTIIAGVFVFAFLASPAISFAFIINYPAIPAPVPGGSFDLNCIDVDWNDFSGCYSTYTLTPTVANIILFLFVGAIWLGGIIALVSLIYTGIQFIISGEDSKKRAAAKDRLAKVLWGLAILLLSVVVLNFINPDITKLEDPYLLAVPTGTVTQPGIPSEPKEKTGVFSCGWDEENEECVVAEDSCGSGYIVDTEWCDNTRYSECVDTEISKDVPCIKPAPQCSDKIDNDNDGLIDYPLDEGCDSETDDDETDAPPVGTCYDQCIDGGYNPPFCTAMCGGGALCDTGIKGYATCLKEVFNTVVTGTTNSNFIKNVWDGMSNATTKGGPGYRTNLIYGGNVLYVRYAPTSPYSTTSCRGFASGANELKFLDPGCLTLYAPAMQGLIQHETGHTITARNPSVRSAFAAALPALVSTDPTCYQFNSTTCTGSYRGGYFNKTYALRYYCGGCWTGISHINESFAEGMRNYLRASGGGGFLCSQNISSIPTQCASTNTWMRTNVYSL